MRPSANGGMALKDLFAVIGGIVVLALLLAPTCTSSKDRSRLTECRSNLTHIGIAMRTYRTDHGDWPASLSALNEAELVVDKTMLSCSETGQEYFHLKPDSTTPPGRFIVSCCTPSTPLGQRPHDHGKAFVGMKADGQVVEIDVKPGAQQDEVTEVDGG